jgi:hypothetical protein
MKINKIILRFVLMLVFASSSVPTSLFAQEIPPTAVRVSGAPDAASALRFQTGLEKLLDAINRYETEKRDLFPPGQASNSLKALVTQLGLESRYDTLQVVLQSLPNQLFETRGLHVYQNGGEYPGWQELALTLDKNAGLIGARMVSESYSIDKYLAATERIPVEDQKRAADALELFTTAFKKKDAKSLSAMMAKDAVITSVSKNKTTGIETVSRMDADGFVKRTRERTFASRDDIDLIFEEPQYLPHVDLEGVVGVVARQNLITSRFTDVGWLFLAIDIDQNPPKILVRHWQEERIQPVKIPAEAKAIKVKPMFWTKDVRSSTEMEGAAPGEGIVTFIIKDPDLVQGFNAPNLNGWLGTGQLKFTNVTVRPDNSLAHGKDSLVVRYEIASMDPVQEFLLDIDFRETNTIAGFQGKVRIFPGKETHVVLELTDPRQPEPKRPALNPYGMAMLITNVRQPSVLVMTKEGHPLFSMDGDNTNVVSVNLLEGEYRLEISRYNYEPVVQDVSVYRAGNTRVEVLLPRIPPAPAPPGGRKKTVKPKPQPVEKKPVSTGVIADADTSRVKTEQVKTSAEKTAPEEKAVTSKGKKQTEQEENVEPAVRKSRFVYWIAGGAIVIGGTVLVLNNAGGGSQGIPTPPGPPTGL